MQTQLDEGRLKQIFKEALIEALEEKSKGRKLAHTGTRDYPAAR